jgi:hypothetical protein
MTPPFAPDHPGSPDERARTVAALLAHRDAVRHSAAATRMAARHAAAVSDHAPLWTLLADQVERSLQAAEALIDSALALRGAARPQTRR